MLAPSLSDTAQMSNELIDHALPAAFQNTSMRVEPPRHRRRGPSSHFKRLDVSLNSMADVASGRCMSSDAFYAGMAVLADSFPARLPKLAFFPTSIYTAFREGSPLATLVPSVMFTEFWNSSITIVPIHAAGRWMLAIVYLARRRIELFNSVGDVKASYMHGEVRCST